MKSMGSSSTGPKLVSQRPQQVVHNPSLAPGKLILSPGLCQSLHSFVYRSSPAPHARERVSKREISIFKETPSLLSYFTFDSEIYFNQSLHCKAKLKKFKEIYLLKKRKWEQSLSRQKMAMENLWQQHLLSVSPVPLFMHMGQLQSSIPLAQGQG